MASALLSPFRAFDRWLFRPASAERLASLRILVGSASLAYLVFFGFEILAPLGYEPRRFRPVGVVALLESPLPSAALVALYASCLGLGICFVLGLRYRLTGPGFAVTLLALATYRNSWGMVFHTENLIVLHIGVLALAPAADAWTWARNASPARASGRYGWAVRAMCMVTVSGYLVAGIAKLQFGGLGWISGDVLRAHVAYDNLLKIESGALYSVPGVWLVRQGLLFTALAVLTIGLELLAPLALLGPRLGRLWVGAAWAFHVGILVFMAIGFVYPLSGIAFASFFDSDQLLRRAGAHRWGRRVLARLQPAG